MRTMMSCPPARGPSHRHPLLPRKLCPPPVGPCAPHSRGKVIPHHQGDPSCTDQVEHWAAPGTTAELHGASGMHQRTRSSPCT